MSRFAQIAAPNGPFVIDGRAVPSPGPGAVTFDRVRRGTAHVRALRTMPDGPV